MSLVLSIEIFIRLNLNSLIKKILELTNKTILSLKSNDDDEIKEKKILENSKNLIICSTKVFLIIFLIILVFYFCFFLDNNFLEYLFSIIGIFESLIILLLYLKVRKFFSAKL